MSNELYSPAAAITIHVRNPSGRLNQTISIYPLRHPNSRQQTETLSDRNSIRTNWIDHFYKFTV